MDARCKSLDGNKYAQVYRSFFVARYPPMEKKSLAGDALRCFTNEYEVPDKLIFDGSGEQTRKNTDFMKNIRRYDIKHHVIEPDRHNQNHAEGTIRELRKKWFRVMLRKKVPRRLWDYGLKNVSETMQ